MRRLYVFLALCMAVTGIYAAETDTHVFTDAQKSFWSLQPVKKPAVPVVKGKQWVKNPIDAFVLGKLEEKQLQPNKPADKLTLLRRVTIDLTGLPPTQGEIQSFLSDNSVGAYEKVVDRLLASPAYGERCHDHKYDPILQKDYYRLQAFFANTSFGDGPLPIKDAAERRKYEQQKSAWEEKTKSIRAEMAVILEPLRVSKAKSGSNTFEDAVQE